MSDPEAEYIGTEPWKPKEALEEDGGEITDKSDIFAYGLTLWEMMTLAMPHLEMLGEDGEEEEEDDGELTGDELFTLSLRTFKVLKVCFGVSEDSEEDSFDEDAYYERLGTRPGLDADALDSAYRRVVELFYLCTEEDPKKRPSAAQIVQALESNAPLGKSACEVIVTDQQTLVG